MRIKKLVCILLVCILSCVFLGSGKAETEMEQVVSEVEQAISEMQKDVSRREQAISEMEQIVNEMGSELKNARLVAFFDDPVFEEISFTTTEENVDALKRRVPAMLEELYREDKELQKEHPGLDEAYFEKVKVLVTPVTKSYRDATYTFLRPEDSRFVGCTLVSVAYYDPPAIIDYSDTLYMYYKDYLQEEFPGLTQADFKDIKMTEVASVKIPAK